MSDLFLATALIESSGDAIVGRRADGIITSWNPGAEEVYGYSADEMIGSTLVRLVPPERVDELSEILAHALKGESVEHFETVRVHKDGRPIHISLTASPIRDGSGTIIGVSHIARDISAQKAAEDERDRFFTLSLDMLCVAGMDGVFRRLNPAWEKILGHSLEDLTSNPFLSYVHPDDQETTIAEMSTLASGGDTVSFENRYRTKDGSYKWILWTATPYVDESLIYASAKDITDRKMAEAALANSEERFRTLSGSSPIGIFETDNAGLCLYTNPRWQSITGISNDDALGEGWIQAIHPDDATLAFEGWAAAVRENTTFELEFRIRTPQGEVRWVLSKASPMLTSSGERIGYVGTVQDVTAGKHAREETRQSNALLAAKNEELEAFTYSVSHDLKEPLRTIEAFSGFVLEDYGDRLDEKGRDYLRRMAQASVRMKRLIDDLLALSRVGRESSPPTCIRLKILIERIADALTPTPDQTHATVAVNDELPDVSGDPTSMEQIFGNLITNALKYNRSPEPRVEVGLRAGEPGMATLYVRDNGIGIDPQYHERIFGIFQRLHRREDYEGTGAGLAIVKRAVAASGGRIWVESELDSGSTFVFTLPLWKSAAPEQRAA